MTADERRLLRAFRDLGEARRQSLLDYAEFLIGRALPAELPVASEPLAIPRPDNESVVKAVKRLRETYPMVDRAKILDAISALLTQHLIHGRPAKDVVDDLEAMFNRHYQALLDQN